MLAVGFGLSAQELCLILAEICFLLAEYRPRPRYRYLDFDAMDAERKRENERIREEGRAREEEDPEEVKEPQADQWEADIASEERSQVYNLRR